MSSLFTPVRIGRYTLPNRFVMAPMTRSRADDTGVQGDFPTATGKGYVRTPGIETEAQVAGWKRVTEAVHAKGGRIFMQRRW